MPKQRITEEMVINAAFELVREEGPDKALVKNIASKLGCSVQPIYSYCANMEGLREKLIERTHCFFNQYFMDHIDRTDYFKSMGTAYIYLAKEEPNLFKFYYMRIRNDIHSLNDICERESDPQITSFISKSLRISTEKAKELHINMLIYTHGISSILASIGSDISVSEFISPMEKAYKAFLAQLLKES